MREEDARGCAGSSSFGYLKYCRLITRSFIFMANTEQKSTFLWVNDDLKQVKGGDLSFSGIAGATAASHGIERIKLKGYYANKVSMKP